MAWGQQRAKYLDRFKRILLDWKEHERLLSDLLEVFASIAEDLELFQSLLHDGMSRDIPFSLFQLHEALSGLYVDQCESKRKIAELRIVSLDIEKKSRFLMAELERTGEHLYLDRFINHSEGVSLFKSSAFDSEFGVLTLCGLYSNVSRWCMMMSREQVFSPSMPFH